MAATKPETNGADSSAVRAVFGTAKTVGYYVVMTHATLATLWTFGKGIKWAWRKIRGTSDVLELAA